VLPWSRFWSVEYITAKPQQHGLSDREFAAVPIYGPGEDPRPSINEISPLGGLRLHWIMSTIMIIIIAQLPDRLVSVGLPGLLQTYGHMLVLGKQLRFYSTSFILKIAGYRRFADIHLRV
jgi:hypothetical protein